MDTKEVEIEEEKFCDCGCGCLLEEDSIRENIENKILFINKACHKAAYGEDFDDKVISSVL